MAPSLKLLLRATAILGFFILLIAQFHPRIPFDLRSIPSPFSIPSHVSTHTPTEAEDRHLSSQECITRYPELYYEADRARDWHHRREGISKQAVDAAERDGGNARLVILDNKASLLFVKAYYGGLNTRTQAAIAAVYRTLLTSPEPLPDVDFVIQTHDAGGGDYPHFVLDRTVEQEHLWLMPDFGFFSWPEPGVGAYDQVRAETLNYETVLELNATEASILGRKTKKLFWRGSPMVEVRQDLLRASRDQPWSDVKELNWGAVNQDEEGREQNNGDLKSPSEHCQFAFLAHVEGYLQQCRSIIVSQPLRYIQHYHHLLNSDPTSPYQNIVEVPLPLDEHLPSVMDGLLDPLNSESVERIAENSWRDMRERWISPAANECYYRYALRQYASVQTFQPGLEQRSVPYESFLLMGTTQWDPHR
ncbi:MAG: hypothetical protein TREMPRED_003509 [Tremellales sp. Tagirdzhanova-0007]|nr:MAG: hypothetical protein TREMPRED_003509 [Tremellales sp. Tagirdzhanova-0007]